MLLSYNYRCSPLLTQKIAEANGTSSAEALMQWESLANAQCKESGQTILARSKKENNSNGAASFSYSSLVSVLGLASAIFLF